MVEAHLNLFDAVVLGIMGFSCLFAFFRGLVREILSLAAWVGAGIVTIYYFPTVADKLAPHFRNATLSAGIATVALYFGSLAMFGLINMILIRSIKSGEAGGTLDNILGLGFGALRGALIVSLGFFLLTIAMPDKEYPKWVAQAATRPYVEKGAVMLAKAAPDYLREISSLQQRAVEKIQERQNQTVQSAPDAAPIENPDAGGYSRTNTRQLDRLIDSTGPGR